MRILFALLLMLSTVQAATVIDTLGKFKEQVRQFTGVESTELLPDTTLTDWCYLAIVNTSTEIGGVEAQYRVLTVAEQKFYSLPDTIVAVLATSLISTEGGTYVIRAGYPQYFDRFSLPRIGVADDAINVDDNSVPLEYHYWADTLQLLPAPIRDSDTLVLKCFIEHPSMTIGGAGDTTASGANNADTNTIAFTYSDYTTAALFLATAYTLYSIDEFDRGDRYFALYEKKKASLIQQYQRRLDTTPTVNE